MSQIAILSPVWLKKITVVCLARPTEKVWIAAPVLYFTYSGSIHGSRKGVFLSKLARISV